MGIVGPLIVSKPRIGKNTNSILALDPRVPVILLLMEEQAVSVSFLTSRYCLF
jgi:hypothetical protein